MPTTKGGKPVYRPDFALYERLKYEWITEHPAATREQYQEAMRAIAEHCKI